MTILSLGLILLTGLFAAKAIRRLRIPIITAYLLLGILIGPACLKLISPGVLSASALISNIVLGMIAFSLGQNFQFQRFARIEKSVFWISILGAVIPCILVTLAFRFLLHQPLYLALIFGAIASATAPAATMLVVREYKARGSFTDTLLGVVAIDDAWCLIIFALVFAVAKTFTMPYYSNMIVLRSELKAILEIGGAFVLGGASAFILSWLSRIARSSADLLIYTLGFVFLTTGLALHFHLSVLLANMFLGAVLININRVSFKFFESLRSVDSPLYLLFFVLVGANLELGLLRNLGVLTVAYIFLRSLGKIFGAYLGAAVSDSPARMKKYLGFALLPQAGVALGIALIVKDTFPEFGGLIFSTIVTATIIYELIGPLFTKLALHLAGEI